MSMFQNDRRFEDFFHNALVGFHLFGPDKLILEMNEFELSLTGYSRREVIGKKTWADLIIPSQIEQFEKHWASLQKREAVRNLSYTLRRKDGREVKVMLNASGYYDNQGNLLNTWGIVVDISEMEKIRRALLESEERFRSMVDTAQEGIWVTDCGQIVRYVNGKMARILGYSADEVIGKPMEAFALDSRYLAEHNLPERRKKGVRERRFQRRDGTSAWVMESSCHFGEESSDCGSIGMVTDIGVFMLQEHRQKVAVRILEELNSAEGAESELVKKIFDYIQEFGDFDLVTMRSNDADAVNGAVTGLFTDERVTQNCMCGNYKCIKRSAVTELFENPRTVWSNRRDKHDFGSELLDNLFSCCQGAGFSSIALIPLHSGKELFGFLQISDHRKDLFSEDDIVFLEGLASSLGIALGRLRSKQELDQRNKELLEKNRELDKLNEELHKANIAKSEFVSVTSHELRTPLAGMIGFAQTLKSVGDELGHAERERFLSIIENEGKRLGKLIDDLLDFTKMEVGAIKMEQACFDISKLAREALETVRMSTSVPVEISFENRFLHVLGDRNRIKQVMINILSNAINHGDGKPVSISLDSADGEVKIGIHDNGEGFRNIDPVRVFDKFYKGKKSGGSGLGLSIAREIITAHRGRIWAQNRDGGGASFYFVLPLCSPMA